MARGNNNAPQSTDSATKASDRVATYAANTAESAAEAGERVAAYAANTAESAAEAGEKVANETTRAGERAGASAATAAGKRIVAEMADRIGNASKAYGPAMEAAFNATRDYNAKLIQIIQMNAEANLRLSKSLLHTRTPADFVETMSTSVRERTELIAWQTKELAALGQEATRRTIEALTPGR